MKFTATDLAPVQAPPVDAYTVEIQLGMGDADGFSEMMVGPFQRGVHEENLESLLGLLERIAAAFPGGMGGDDNYDHIPGYIQWFKNFLCTPENLQTYYPKAWASATPEEHAKFSELSEGLYKKWPQDPTLDNQSPQYLGSYKVFYYDTDSVKHNVAVELEG